jgi:hypothetical protein
MCALKREWKVIPLEDQHLTKSFFMGYSCVLLKIVTPELLEKRSKKNSSSPM